MIVEQLIENAVFPNPSQIAFAKKRSEGNRRDASYNVESSSDDYSVLLNVNLTGNISAQVSLRNGYICQGKIRASQDWETVRWSDSHNPAIIRTELSFDDLQGDISAPEIMAQYVEAIAAQGDAMCAGGYAHWRMQVQMLIDMISQRTKKRLEINLIPSMTTCPGMEYIRPWHQPSYEAYVIEDQNAHPVELAEQDMKALQAINQKCMPRRSSILLHPPFMIRAQSREIFLSNEL